jgi:hypothetical protein
MESIGAILKNLQNSLKMSEGNESGHSLEVSDEERRVEHFF